MNQCFTARRLAFAVVALGLSLTGCKDTVEVSPDSGNDYYPVAVGNFWVYAVADTTWNLATPSTPSVRTATAFQFKETITETLTDAAGQKAYRLVRAKRLTPADAWRNDSVFILTANQQFVALTRNNARTLELIFPVREGRSWNFNAFNNNSNDTITAETRQYSRIGQPFTTAAVAGSPAIAYPATVTTTNTGTAADNNLIKILNYQQIFAKKVGPVSRKRRNLQPYYYNGPSGNPIYVPGSYFSASVRHETLIDYGPR
ncbi:hypothetical protein [Hymenobacter antarcticus]|uniref:hypothetical protein n=1 Tax=Hymenobacter antarcticus TaxID=486270 RepID=UPI0031E76FA4